MNVYGFCDDKCRMEVVSREDYLGDLSHTNDAITFLHEKIKTLESLIEALDGRVTALE